VRWFDWCDGDCDDNSNAENEQFISVTVYLGADSTAQRQLQNQ
jgi:hypothetical protein